MTVGNCFIIDAWCKIFRSLLYTFLILNFIIIIITFQMPNYLFIYISLIYFKHFIITTGSCNLILYIFRLKPDYVCIVDIFIIVVKGFHIFTLQYFNFYIISSIYTHFNKKKVNERIRKSCYIILYNLLWTLNI